MSATYQSKKEIETDLKTAEIINDLPFFCVQFFDHLSDTCSPNTRLQYAYDLKRFFGYLQISAGFTDCDIKSMTAHEILDTLTVEDIQEYLKSFSFKIRKDGSLQKYSRAYMARLTASIRSLYHYFYKLQKIEKDLGVLLDTPVVPGKEIQALDKEQVHRLLEAILSPSGMNKKEYNAYCKVYRRDYALVVLILGTGLRISECLGIDLSDLDFKNNTVIVSRKGGDQDVVYFSRFVADALEDYIDNGRDFLVAKSGRSPALFLSTQRERLSADSVQRLLNKYTLKAGLNIHVTPHSLRRTFGTNLYSETGDIYLVSTALHHSSVETTRKHYAKMDESRKKTASEIADTIFGKKK